MENTDSKFLFLQEVRLSGYKSVDLIEIKFQKGLNIIIGKNAAGKTNFLKFLDKCLSFNYDELFDFSAELNFKNGRDITIKTSKHTNVEQIFDNSKFSSKINSDLIISKKIVKDKKDKNLQLIDKLKENKIIFDTTFLCHGIPKDYLIVDKPISFKIGKKGFSSELTSIFTEKNYPYFLKCIAIDIFLTTLNKDETDPLDIRKRLTEIFTKIETLKDTLQTFSPIEDMRFSENYNIFEDNNDTYTINNLFLEFKIDGNWLPFNNLSDGTKRIFYIISEISEYDTNRVRPSSQKYYYSNSEINRIILIEEPELGIHPHQFHKLMNFLKEQSDKKQIIMTTHSPQALDALEEDEFNRIIIAYSTHSTDGTKLRHLNTEELIKAKAYIKEDFLSDYWLYSDLEK